MNVQETVGSYGWQKATQPNQSDNGKMRETRTESVRPGNPAVTQGGNR
ncbi:MAG TPA: hypothetical protein VGM27_12760 [Acidobacteriaceae bacterium]